MRREVVRTSTYAGQGGLIGAIGILVASHYSQAFPDASAEQIASVTAIVTILGQIALKMGRDWYYRKFGPPSLVSLVLLVLLVAPGCAKLGGQMDDMQPVMSRTFFNAEGEPIGQVSVSLGTELASRGCIALDIEDDGAVSFILQQDGSSDWSTVRGLASIIPETVAVAMNPVSGPIEAVISTLTGRAPLEPPSEIHGCTGLFVGEKAEEPAD